MISATIRTDAQGRQFRSDRKNLEKRQLMEADPHCVACGRLLTLEPCQENSAHLVRHSLACAAHQIAARSRWRKGEEGAIIQLTAKGEQYLEKHRPIVRLVEMFVVDGQPFERYQDAESRAIELAQLLGAKVEILVGLVNSGRLKVSQVVRPGDDARCREESYHRERRQAIDVCR